ncbi:glucosamine-6-phosphate deaminase [Arcanobacterium hippocoleae]|uniref:Glucosamine-6-phosphate deaminase n=1 Tax=Arcanobacterium hippocoleae TaxID=149017 RepID=A0ABU1T3E6_9ACTO|nr:glucosamine-6-phosphate deaminase [Arcanobacterium hippocoleae]MDR6939755.1 glucosamine-6-phosphate deaminase [Arcanobacterium hippocoleae]
MEVGIFATEAEVADAAAKHLFTVLAAAEQKVLGVATGSTPLPLYERMRAAYAAGEFSLAEFKAFALDEYVGIDPEHPERYRNVLRAELVGTDKTGLCDENLFTPDGNAADPDAAADAYDAQIREHGPIALQILGIGADGHIGFNEPGISLVSRTHTDVLTEQTRKDNMRFFDDDIEKVPAGCVTQGLGTIMDAAQVLLIATGANKADAVKELVEGGISALWPASILQLHPKATVLVDEAAAAKLKLADFYRGRWEAAHK